MRVWPGLIAAPLLALLAISAGYALVPAACGAGREWMLHAVFLVSLVLAVAASFASSTRIKSMKDPFLPLVATGTGALFSLVIAATWAMALFISPCTR